MAIWRQLRQISVARWDLRPTFCCWFLVAVGLVLVSASRGAAGTAELYWSDSQTGLAIGGFDPVSYFVDGHPRAGKADYELKWGGTTWRFVNQGNREVFRRDPLVYAPQFGGYDALQVARGFITPGNPLTWVIRQQRLYFFENRSQRNQWPQDAAMVQSQAVENWPGLRHTLVK